MRALPRYWVNTDTGEVTFEEPPEDEDKSAAELKHAAMKAKIAAKKKKR